MLHSPLYSPQEQFIQWVFFQTDALPLLGLQLFEEVAGVSGPEILFKSKAGYNDYQRETQTPQEVQDHMEDKQMKVTGCKKLVQWVQDKIRRLI